MNEQAKQFSVEWLKKRGFFDEDSISDGLVGEFTLELIETYLDQKHDQDSLKNVPGLFYIIVKELLDNGYDIL